MTTMTIAQIAAATNENADTAAEWGANIRLVDPVLADVWMGQPFRRQNVVDIFCEMYGTRNALFCAMAKSLMVWMSREKIRGQIATANQI